MLAPSFIHAVTETRGLTEAANRGRAGRGAAGMTTSSQSVAALLLLLAAAPPAGASCGQSLLDSNGAFWYLNLTALQAADADYVVHLSDGTDVNVNFCAPAKQLCLPASRVSGPELVRGVATRQWGALPAPGQQCFLASDTDHRFPLACTRECEVMGAGAVGTLAGDWEFIVPTDPRDGIRATHWALPTRPANATTAAAAGTAAAGGAAWQPPCGMDEWGNPRPRRVVFNFVCDASASGAVIDAPTEVNGADAKLQCTTTLRVRSAAPCFNFSWQLGAWDECQAEVAGKALATRRRAIGCGAPGTTSTEGRFCEQLGTKPTDVEFCQLPAPCLPGGKQEGGGGGGGGDAQGGAMGTPPAKGSGVAGVVGLGGVGVCVTQPNAWEQAAAVCSALSLLGLLLGAMMVFTPPGGFDRSRGGGAAAEEDRAPLAYAAPRVAGQRVPYDYEAF